MKKAMSILWIILLAVLSLPKVYWQRLTAPGMLKREPTSAGMALLAYQPVDAEITVTQSASGTFLCSIQLIGPNGKDMTVPAAVWFYLSSDSAGMVQALDGTDTSEIAIATDGLLQELITDIGGWLISEPDGDIGLTITVESGKVAYLVLIMPDGRLVISDAMTYGM